MSAAKRDLPPVPALQARRALDAAVLASNPSIGMLRVWTVIANYTVGYGRLSDALTHGRIATEAGVGREAVRRALNSLEEAGVIRYTAGFGDPGAGRNAYSRVAVVLPKETPPVSGVPTDESEGDPSREWGETPPVSGVSPLQPEVTPPLPRVGTDPSGERGNWERTTEEGLTARGQTGEDIRGVAEFVGHVEIAREEEPPTPMRDSHMRDSQASTPSTALVLAARVEDQSERQPEPEWGPEPEWDGDLDSLNDWLEEVCPTGPAPEPVTRRVGAATGAQAVARFVAETGLPLSKRTREALARSLDEVAPTVSPNEMLMALGYWHEKRGGRWPEDAAERVGEAMAYEHGCLLDPANALTPAEAAQEGRCRAKMALLPRQERGAAEADPFFRIQGFGLAWPAPASPAGLLPEARPSDGEVDPFAIPLGEWRRALAPAGRPG